MPRFSDIISVMSIMDIVFAFPSHFISSTQKIAPSHNPEKSVLILLSPFFLLKKEGGVWGRAPK
jgi:hypothetical protein